MRAQDSDRELDQDVAPTQAPASVTIDDPNRQLPHDLERRVMALQPGDVEGLVTLARMHPEFLDAILTQASASAGNQTVAQAIDLLAAAPVTGPSQAAGDEAQVPKAETSMMPDYAVDAFDYESSVLTLEGGDIAGDHVRFILLYPHLRYQVLDGLAHAHPELLDEAMERLHKAERQRGDEDDAQDKQKAATNDGADAPETTQGPAPGKEEASWVVGARRYNDAHPEQVEEFNRLTNGACLTGEGLLDPKLISDWQAMHGVSPDGRVGPNTVDAARRAAGIGTPIPMPEGDLGLE